MTRAEIVDLLNRRADAWRHLDAETLVADYAEDAIIDSPLAGGTTQGRDQIRQVFQTYFVAFPDLGMDVEEVLVDDQRAAVMATFTGTDRGGFMVFCPSREPRRGADTDHRSFARRRFYALELTE